MTASRHFPRERERQKIVSKGYNTLLRVYEITIMRQTDTMSSRARGDTGAIDVRVHWLFSGRPWKFDEPVGNDPPPLPPSLLPSLTRFSASFKRAKSSRNQPTDGKLCIRRKFSSVNYGSLLFYLQVFFFFSQRSNVSYDEYKCSSVYGNTVTVFEIYHG